MSAWFEATKKKIPSFEWIVGAILVFAAGGLITLIGFGYQAAIAERPSLESTETVEDTPVPEPKQERPFPDVGYSGSGDKILPLVLTGGPGSIGIASITHTGSSNFSIWALNENLEQIDLLVDAVGNYGGTVPFNLSKDIQIFAFEITADGPWTVTLKDVLSLEEIRQGSSLTGEGDGVLLYTGERTIANVSHEGQNNFALRSHTKGNAQLLVETIGNYSGEVAWEAGPRIFQVSADGVWSIELQQ